MTRSELDKAVVKDFRNISQESWLEFFEMVRSHCSLVGTDGLDYNRTYCEDCGFCGKKGSACLFRGPAPEDWDDETVKILPKSMHRFCQKLTEDRMER